MSARREGGLLSPGPRAALLLAAGLQVGLQVEMTARHWARPFLDGALHYDYDNADFTRRARDGIRLGEARSQLGVTELRYATWGVPVGEPAFYTHHPFLLKAVFQLAVRAFGDAEWVSRAFALLVAALAAEGTLVALWLATGSVAASTVAALVLVNTPVFATYQACIKYELDGMALGTWFFVAVALALRAPSRVRALLVGLLAFLAALAHWTALLLAAAVAAWLCWEWLVARRSDARRPAVAAGMGLAVGVAAVLLAFAWLAGGWSPIFQDLRGVAQVRSDLAALPPGAWLDRQRLYVGMNFGATLPWIAGALALWLAAGARWRRRPGEAGTPHSRRLLSAFFWCTLAAAVAWQLGFPQGSFVHVYWQLWFVLPVAALVAAAIARLDGPRSRAAAVAAGLLLAVHLHLASRDAYAELLRLQRGTPEDVRFLASLRHDRFSRFVFVPIHDAPLNAWFTGPIFPYYTDREVVPLASAGPLVSGDRLLLLRHQGQEELVSSLGRHLGVRLDGERCGARFCAYDLVP